MRILLINSGNDSNIDGNANRQCYPPLGIISLGTVLEKEFGDRIEICLLDGQIDDINSICGAINAGQPDLVGVSMYCTSIRNTITTVKEAKNVGAITVVGNDHASFHHQVLLRKISEIDFVCVDDMGEETIVELVRYFLYKGDLDNVPSLAYRVGNTIFVSPPAKRFHEKDSLDSLPIPNRRLLPARNWDHYLTAFRGQHHKYVNPAAVSGVTTINRARGCSRFGRPCTYCGIADLRIRASSSRVFWQDVRIAIEQVGANYFYEAFDSATSGLSILRKWLVRRPDDIEQIMFEMYAQARETNENTVDVFKRLGVACVNMGLDSGHEETLKLLRGPKDTLETNKRAVRLWSDAGIEIYASFVIIGLGSESRTRESLDATMKFATWLSEETSTVSFDCALLYPDKSSILGQWIWKPDLAKSQAKALGWDFIDYSVLEEISKKWSNEVFIDPLEINGDFARLCGVKPEVLYEYDEILKKISQNKRINFGRSQGGPER